MKTTIFSLMLLVICFGCALKTQAQLTTQYLKPSDGTTYSYHTSTMAGNWDITITWSNGKQAPLLTVKFVIKPDKTFVVITEPRSNKPQEFPAFIELQKSMYNGREVANVHFKLLNTSFKSSSVYPNSLDGNVYSNNNVVGSWTAKRTKHYDFFDLGVTEYEAGKNETALDYFNKAIEIDYSNATFYNYRGMINRNLKKLDSAIADFTKAIALNQKFANAYFNRATTYLLVSTEKTLIDDSKAIIADADKAISLSPNYAFAYAIRARANLNLNNRELAIADINKALQLDPNFKYAQDLLAEAKSNSPNTNANTASGTTQTSDSEKVNFQHKQGSDHLKAGNYLLAITNFSECLRLNPNADPCYALRATALIESSKRELETPKDFGESLAKWDGASVRNATRQKALADINKAIQLNPKDTLYYFIRAQLYKVEEISEKSYLDYKQALTINPKLATENSNLYQTLKSELAQAEKKYSSWLKTRGDDAVNRALALAQSKQAVEKIKDPTNNADVKKIYQQAIDFYTKSLELDKTNLFALSSRALTYKFMKNYPAAIADYTAVIKAEPNKPESYNKRADVYLEQKQTALALADYDKVIALPMDSGNLLGVSNALAGRGKIRFESGQIDGAIADFDKVVAQTPEYLVAYFYRGQAHAKKGNKTKAIADFKKALEIAPDYEEAIIELKKLGVRP